MAKAAAKSAGKGSGGESAKPRVALVTGAASGIGAAAVRLLLAEGQQVCAVDIAPVPTSDIAAGHNARLITERCDVSDWAQCQRAVAAAVDRFGRLDSLLHFAAIHSTKRWDEIAPDEFTRVLAVNVTGSFLMAKAAAEHMKEHGGGAIVLTGSGSTNAGGTGGEGRGGPAYVSSKGAIVSLHRSLARSFGPYGIRVNAVSPGPIATAMTANYSTSAKKRVDESTIAGRIGRPDEVAAVAIFLASDQASYVTGEIVNVNGGGAFGL